MILAHPGEPGSLLGALASVLGPLGMVLGRSWGLLGISEGILGRSWGILDRSWGILIRSWVALGGSWLAPGWSWGSKRALAREPVWPGPNDSTPPPGETPLLTPHPLAHFQLEKGDGNTGKMKKYHKKN
jgi:hypothetical protein